MVLGKKNVSMQQEKTVTDGVIEKNLRNIKLNEYFKNHRQRKEEGRAPRD